MRILIVDFHDSFTYNLYHYFEAIGAEVVVCNDENVALDDLDSYSHVVLSPGPGLPTEKRNLFNVIQKVKTKKPILGVCLGMQGIAEFEGASLYNLNTVKHGVSEEIRINTHAVLFKDIPDKINVGLYHSWAVSDLESTSLKSVAESNEGVVMAIEDRSKKLFGVQFHPESILSDHGKKIIMNFIQFV